MESERRRGRDRTSRSRSPVRRARLSPEDKSHDRHRDLSPRTHRSRNRTTSPSASRRHRARSRSGSDSRSPSPHGHGRKRRHRSRSVSTSGESSGEGRDRKHHRHGKDKKHDKHDKGKSKHKSRRSSHSRERKERKKEKKKNKSAAVTAQWGKYGIISDADMYNKEQEFRAWLLEECMLNLETMSKDQTKKQFAKFVEDFNTATLPHEKYYAMENYERRMASIRNGEYVALEQSYDPNKDMAAHGASHKRVVQEQDSYLSREQLSSLRKVQHERIEAGKMKVLGLEVKNSMGVRMDGNQFEGMGR